PCGDVRGAPRRARRVRPAAHDREGTGRVEIVLAADRPRAPFRAGASAPRRSAARAAVVPPGAGARTAREEIGPAVSRAVAPTAVPADLGSGRTGQGVEGPTSRELPTTDQGACDRAGPWQAR